MKILALDLGKFKTMCCLFDSNSRAYEFFTETTDRHYLSTIFKNHKVDLVVMEACGPSGWIAINQSPPKNYDSNARLTGDLGGSLCSVASCRL